MSRPLAAIIGGAVGGIAVMIIVIVLVCFCISHSRSVSRTSGTGSSETSIQGQNVGQLELSIRGGIPLASEGQGGKQFSLEELASATKGFSDINLIGQGKFGQVYKGLLVNGVIVAIKKRQGSFTQNFIEEVHYLSSIRHRHIVSLLGYCMENNQQVLVYEYIPSGSVSSHLYGTAQITNGKLEFKHRLSIAVGAAKGLAYLHAMNPPLLHKDFRTTNVLVDENYVAKVADAGLLDLSRRTDIAGPSSQTLDFDDVFHDPEVEDAGRLSEKSDVYAFGVFLLELVSGREAKELPLPDSSRNMIQWVQNYQEQSDDTPPIIDPKLVSSFTADSMKELINIIVQSVHPSGEARPSMRFIASELERILEKEINLTTLMGESTPIVTLGSQLFGPR